MREPSPTAAAPADSSAAVPAPRGTTRVAPLSPWLQLMLAEIARAQEELERAHHEEMQRSSERAATRR